MIALEDQVPHAIIILSNLPPSFLQNPPLFHQLLLDNGAQNIQQLLQLKSFKRYLVVFSTTMQAQQLLPKLNNMRIKDYSLVVFYGQHTLNSKNIEYLKVPEKECNFLLSPPGIWNFNF